MENLDTDIHLANCDHCTKTFDAASGNYYHMGGCSVLRNKVKRLQIKMLAANIKSAKQFRKIILDAKPRFRQGVYDLIAPEITGFIPPPYRSIVRGDGRQRGPRD